MAVYKGLEATLHEAFWGDRGADIEFEDLKRLFPEFSGTALFVGSGSGRILLPFAELGWNVKGMEPSAEMIELFRKKDTATEVVQSTFEDYVEDEQYDLIVMTSYVFMLFEDPRKTLEKVKRLLKPGGKLYFSTFVPWAEIVGELIEGEWLLDDQIKLSAKQKARCWVNFELDRVNHRLVREHRYELLEGKKVLEETKTCQKLRWYTLPELKLLLEIENYKVLAHSYDFSPNYDCDAHSLGIVSEI